MTADQNPLGRLIARAVHDEAYRKRLLDDPHAVLRAEGIALPEGVRVTVVEDTEDVRHLVLPKADRRPLSDEEVQTIDAGLDTPVTQMYPMCGSNGDWTL